MNLFLLYDSFHHDYILYNIERNKNRNDNENDSVAQNNNKNLNKNKNQNENADQNENNIRNLHSKYGSVIDNDVTINYFEECEKMLNDDNLQDFDIYD